MAFRGKLFGGEAQKTRLPFRRPKMLVIALGAAIGVMVYFGVQLYQQMTVLRISPRDNVQWTLSQLEVDQLLLTHAIMMAAEGLGTLDEVRSRFDNFYSRLTVVAEGRTYANIRSAKNVGPSLHRLQLALDELIPLIDGPDERLQEALLEIDDRLMSLRPAVRAASLEGVRLFAEETDARNETFLGLLATVSLIAIGLIIILVLTVLFMIRAYRILAERNEEVARNRKRLAATINGALDAIVVIDDNDRIIEFNEAAEKVFGYPREMALGARAGELIVPEKHRKAHEAGVTRFVGGGAPRLVDQGRIELSAIRSDGTEFPIELSISSAVGDSGPIFVGYLRDISARLEAEQALTVARDRALAAERAKSEFIAVTSHEMRTPLNGVLGVLDILKEMRLNKKQRYLIDTAVTSGEILLRHINDVLDISQVEASKTSLKEPVELADILEQVARVSAPAAGMNGNLLELNVSPDIGPILSDPHRIRQVVLNLVGNAVKFTENGTIVVEARRLPTEGGPGQVEISVSDTGIGIAEEDLDRIFEDFVTLDTSYQRRSTGSGLGLAICRRIVATMGGKIGVESKPGRGSRFWVRLPAPTAGMPESREPATIKEAGLASVHEDVEVGPLDVLVVEDNHTNRVVVREMLQRLGHKVTEAFDGTEGVEKASLRAYDLILMDISMPGLDGVEATREIRAGSGPSRDAVIIGLTAHANPEEHKQFLGAGMQDLITKPLRTRTLKSVIAGATSPRDSGAKEESHTAGTGGQGPHLIDSEVISDLAQVLPRDVFAKTLARTSDEILSLIPEIRAAADSGDLETAARKAHLLAGSAALVGAQRLHLALFNIESACKEQGGGSMPALLDDDFAATAEATREALSMIGSGG